MANQYGTKRWAKWANQNLSLVLSLLKEPSKQWDEKQSYLECAVRNLTLIHTELDKIITK